MKTPFRLFSALVAWITLILQYYVMVSDGEFGSAANATLMFLGYFTILTNILVALAFTAPFLRDGNRINAFFLDPHVRAAIALYITVVAVIYHLLLSALYTPTGLPLLTDIGLHTAIPILFVIDWLVFADKRGLSYATIHWWVAYPLVYAFATLARGLLTGFYPYPFLDVTTIGLGGFFKSMLGFIVLYAVGAALFILVGRMLEKRQA